ncbi:MAG: hypothetical protein KA264_02225 [Crocinitomicaceae bacterium]|jgi:RNA recognition motif-containing protein|nr:hypothetical protein [Crocinitomicaceae bacterium]
MTNIFVARLDYGVTQEELKSTFEQYGQVNKVSLAIDKETGKSKGFAFIEMKNEEEAHQAIKGLDGLTLHGRQIAVKIAEDRNDNRPKREFNSNDRERRPAAPRENREHTGGNKVDSEYKNPKFDSPEVFIPPVIPQVNKVNDKKKDLSAKKHDDRPKTQKMPAYKKSGKQNKFFYDDEDDDLY